MIPPLSSNDFLLRSPLSQRLYHEHAASLPIIDYHSHLSAADLAADRQFRDLTHLWLEPDQYKHRAMRLVGVPERAITGDAPPREKFDHWAATLPQTLGNPLFHWSALELRRSFGITAALDSDSADTIWAQANDQLSAPSHSARSLLAAAGVELVCTSDLWLDTLAAHRTLAASDFGPRVLPSLRADEALAIDEPGFSSWVDRLAAATGTPISNLEGFQSALARQLDIFAAHGCTIADHGIDTFDYAPANESVAAVAFARVLAGGSVDAAGSRSFRSHLLAWLGSEYGRRGWALQLHLGAQRHTSTRLRRLVGRAGGFAAIGRTTDMAALCRFLDDLELGGHLPKTILYPLHPGDFPPFAAVTGSFSEDGTAGKVQLGPPWWFNDHELGFRQHFDTLSHIGVFSTFIGMTTDSRSLLSLSRHDYFRRVLCDYLGQQVESGRFPNDEPLLAGYVRRLSYENARAWLPAASPVIAP